MSSLVWFITGVSSGIGFALAKHVLAEGHKVIGTVRNRTKEAENLKQLEAAGAKLLILDVSRLKDIPEIIHAAEAVYGRIDVLVNNAAYLILGPLEDTSDDEAHQLMLTNFYGPLAIIRAALPKLRQQRSGTIINISSSVAIDAMPAVGIYSASKYALDGITDSLAQETGPFGIRTILVAPGMFRTSGLNPANMKKTSGPYTADYDVTPVKAIAEMMGAASAEPKYMPGDPAKGVARIFEVVTGTGLGADFKDQGAEGQALRIILGTDALEVLEKKIKKLEAVTEHGRRIAVSTNFV